jgi:NAD(P)-dependent dehydrogenase (short-subunit alcohol dehydrogenase family)
MIQAAINEFGTLNCVVNNAGILRDRTLANMSIDEWDAVIRVHLRGTFCMSHHAAVYWRDKAKSGQPADGRIINTTSPTGLYGNIGQANYGAAKAGIAQFTIIGAMELGRYGVTVNCISPGARTRMTETLRGPGLRRAQEGDFDAADPDNISPLVVWLASPEASDINGQIFSVRGGHIGVIETAAVGPEVDKGARWEPAELGPVIHDLVARARPRPGVDGHVPTPAHT